MTICKNAMIFAVGMLVASTSWAKPLTAKMMHNDLNFVHSVFEASYAPKAWKKTFAGWELDKEAKAAHDAIDAAERAGKLTLGHYHQVLQRFIRSTKDYHVSVGFHRTAASQLHFQVKKAGSEYIIVAIDRKKLSQGIFPFEIGDTLVEFDGRPVAKVIDEIMVSLGGNSKLTEQSLAERILTHRRASRGEKAMKGPIEIKVKSQSDGKMYVRQLIWEHTREVVGGADSELASKNIFEKFVTSKKMRADFSEEEEQQDIPRRSPLEIGARTSFIPRLGRVFWQSEKDSHFDAYIYRSEKNEMVGVVRIRSYSAGAPQAEEFSELVQMFEKKTDKLVIDQVNNPGGSVFYLYSLVSMLTDQVAATPRHRMTITQGDVVDANEIVNELKDVKDDESARKAIGETLGGYPVDYQVALFMRDYAQFIIDQWNSGKVLSDPYHIYGVDKINPHPEGVYTKPILLLVNELDFSGGDFFPAILQDNKRVTILGSRTAGAGGYVYSVEYPNALGVSYFRLTGSIAERVDRNPIENLGVKPDIEVQLTAEDYRNGYKNYKEAILKAVDELK